MVRYVLLLLLLLLPLATASESFYNSWVYPGDTFTVKEELYTVTEGWDPYEILITRGDVDYVLKYGSCTRSHDGLEKYCFEDSDYVDCDYQEYDCPDNSEEIDEFWCCPYDVSHIQFRAGRALWGSKVNFYDVIPPVTVTRSPEQNQLKLGERNEISVTLENTGENPVTSAIYIETIPEGFRILTHPDFEKKGNTLVAKINIIPDERKLLRYVVEPIIYGDGTFKSNLSYSYKGEEQQVTPPAFTLDVPSPYTVTTTLSNTGITADDEATFTYTITNEDGAHDMDALVEFYGLAEILDQNGLPRSVREGEGLHTWKENLKVDESETLTFLLQPKRTGSYELTTSTVMTLDEETFTKETKNTIVASVRQMTPSIKITPATIRSGEEYFITLFLDNAAGDVSFGRIETLLQGSPADLSGILQRRQSFDAVSRGENRLLAEHAMVAPIVESDTTLTFTFSGSYFFLDEEFSFSKTGTAVIREHTVPYAITQSVNDTNVTPGKTLAVAVTVKNQDDEYRSFLVEDSMPLDIALKAGARENELSLSEGTSKEVYKYNIQVPLRFNQKWFTITTTLTDQLSGEQYKASTDVAVYNPSLNIEEEIDEQPAEEEILPETEEKKDGFVKSLVRDVVDFFKGIFS